MSTITIDSLEVTRKLREAGFDEQQAKSVVRVLADPQGNLVTRDHLDYKLDALRDVLRLEIAHTRWMIALLFVLSLANFVIQS